METLAHPRLRGDERMNWDFPTSPPDTTQTCPVSRFHAPSDSQQYRERTYHFRACRGIVGWVAQSSGAKR